MAQPSPTKYTNRQKATLAISLFAAMLITIALISLVSFSNTQKKLEKVTSQYQPKMLSALQLTTHFYHSLSVLGNYMIEQDEYNLELYQQKLADINKSLTHLVELTDQNTEIEDADQLIKIRSLVDGIIKHNASMFELAEDVNKNMPALGIAFHHLEPSGTGMNQIINDLFVALEEDGRTTQMRLVDQLRYNWIMVESQVRNYLAFRNTDALDEIKLYLNGVTQSVDSLQSQFSQFDDEQQELLSDFFDLFSSYQKNLDQVLSIHSSEGWRSDRQLMHNDISPALKELTAELEVLVSLQQQRINESNIELAKQIESAENTIIISIQVGLAISVLVLFLNMRTRRLMNEIEERRRIETEILHKANHDGLTNVPNRCYFVSRLDEKFMEDPNDRKLFALLFIDLDGFKSVNDDVGHDAGDFVLVEVADRLQCLVRSSDMVARIGGDEFTVMLEDVPNRSVVERKAQDICDAIRKPYLFNGKDLKIGCSIGVAYSDDVDISAETDDEVTESGLLIKRADEAMYVAKNSGKNQYYVHQ